MGRPKKHIRKTEKITVRFSPEEKQLIAYLATRSGFSESEVIRFAALNLKFKPRFSPEEKILIRQLQGVALNLNQLAKGVNSGSQLYEEIKQQVEEIRSYLNG